MATKALTKSDVIHKLERWADAQRRLNKLGEERDAEARPVIEQCERAVAEIDKKYDKRIANAEAKADELSSELTTWLKKHKSPLTVESKRAIAEIVYGSKDGSRTVDPQIYLARAKTKKVADPWKALQVLIGEAEKALGKEDLDKIATKPRVPMVGTSVRLK